jgi:glycosyltransferase involved in cell wall biosynthesis
MQTKVSMVVPCYNKADYIDEFIQSVYNQEYDNIELIFVNDGSTDGTKEKLDLWVSKLVKRGFDVVMISQANKGVGTAVHSGLKQMTGEYICMPDCDDVLHSDYVSRMSSVLDNNQFVQWVQCNTQSDDKFVIFYKYNLIESYLLHSFFWTVWSKMIRRSYFDDCKILENFIDSRTTQECQISLPLVLGGEIPYIIEENLYDYRIIGASIMGQVKSEKLKIYKHWEDMKNLNIKVLKIHGACSKRNIKLCEIMKKKLNWNGLRDSASYDDLLETICASDLINSEQITILKKYKNTMSAEHIFLAFKYMLIGVEPANDLESRLKESRRLICCAVMSETARDFLDVVLDAGIRPDVFWDQSAIENSTISGMPVCKPDYNSVTEDDTVIIFAKKVNVINEIKSLCNTKRVFGYNDVVQYLSYVVGRN